MGDYVVDPMFNVTWVCFEMEDDERTGRWAQYVPPKTKAPSREKQIRYLNTLISELA